ncbi:MAG: dipeptidase [Clostridia bacterium]|nr:dipeptidase [Clostridia bacterium]
MKHKFIDMHCDTISELYYRKCEGKPYSLYENDLDIDIKRLAGGGAYVQCFAMFTYLTKVESAYEHANALIEVYKEQLELYKDHIAPVLSFSDIDRNEKDGKISAMMTLEEGECTEGSPEKLKHFYDLGARMMNITWNFKNSLGHPNIIDVNNGSVSPDTENGLTEKGKAIVEYMMELGMVVDTSHSSDRSFYDVADIVKGPFIASHSNCRELCGHTRNLTDDMIRVLAEHGGVSGLNYCPAFIKTGAERITADDFADHVLHFIKVGGEDVVGLGTDYDGISSRRLQIKDPSYAPVLWDTLVSRGLSEDQADKVFYKNVKRVFRDVLK